MTISEPDRPPTPRRDGDAEPAVCPLCRREAPRAGLTRHHLTPRAAGGARLPTADLCRTCHRQLHALYTNAELAALNSIERLRADERLAPYLRWISRRPGTTIERVRTSRARRGRG